MKLSVVVPCYNEEQNLPFLAARFEQALKGLDAELVLVNNGSTDNSQQVLDKIAKEYSLVRLAKVENNIGYGHGILTGLKAAKGDVLSWTHADMQCDPEDIRKAYEIFQKSSEKTMVKGKREGRFSFLTSCFHIIASVLFLKRFDDINGQPKLFPRELMQTFRNPPTGFQLDFYVQNKAKGSGYKIVSIPVKFRQRKFGESKWARTFKSRAKTTLGFLGYMFRLRLLGE